MSHSLPDLWPGWRQDRQQVESGHAEGRTGVGEQSSSPGARDRCECQFSSSKLLRTEAENKHLGFRDDIPRYQPLANSSTYIRGQDTAVFQLWCRLAVRAAQRTRGERREVNMRSRPWKLISAKDGHFKQRTRVDIHVKVISSVTFQPSLAVCGSYWWW